MKVLMVSTQFPKGHIRAGQDTNFVEKIWSGLSDSILDNWYKPELSGHWTTYQKMFRTNTVPMPKLTTIRKGQNWKVGDWASLRVWGGKPYGKGVKQIEFAQVEIKKVWDFELFKNGMYDRFILRINDKSCNYNIEDLHLHSIYNELIKNDGVSSEDFLSWFDLRAYKLISFCGQIISWSDTVNY